MTREVMRLTRNGIWANPDVEIDNTAKIVLAALDAQLKELVQKAVAAEREACAKLCDELRDEDGFEPYGTECAAAIRTRGRDMKSSKQKRTCTKCGQMYSASAFTTRTGFTCKWCAEGRVLEKLPEDYLRLMDKNAALCVTNYALEHSLRELLEEYHPKELWTDEHIEYEMQQGNMMAPVVKRAYAALRDAIRARGESK